MFPRRLYPGQKLTAAEQNDLQRAVHRQGHVSGTGSNTVAVNPSGLIVRDNAPESIYGRISGAPTGSVYPWVEVAWDGSAWDDLTVWPGRSGTAASGGAKELTGSTTVPTNTIVQLTPLPGGGGWGFSWGASTTFTLTTGNTSSGAQDSTTTELRFDDATKIKITKGATAGDPDVVSMDGLDATTTGLTIPGTTVKGVVTATRSLPALPRAWANFAGRGTNGACTVYSNGGELGSPTIDRYAAGAYTVTWAGMNINAAAFCSGVSSAGLPMEIGTLLSTFGGNHIDLSFTVGGTADDPSDVYVTVIY